MQADPLISVVMATYNGARFLAEQLDSIYAQTHKNIEVVICDDSSSDATVDILKTYASRYGLRYYINKPKGGVIRNFERALGLATGNYIALADQDDVWVPEKLEMSLQELRKIEKEENPVLPVLVFTDLKVVSEDLSCISPSYWDYMKLNPANYTLNRLLIENVATGCTILLNKATVKMALPIPAEALMHDIWLLLTASCFGKVSFLAEPTVLYRQHSANVVGARTLNLIQKLKSGYYKLIQQKAGLLNPEINQAKAFYNKFYQLLATRTVEKNVLETFISLKEKNIFLRKYLIYKNSFYGGTLKKALNVLIRA